MELLISSSNIKKFKNYILRKQNLNLKMVQFNSLKSKTYRKLSEFILFKFFHEIKVKKDNIKFLMSKNNYQLREILRSNWEKVMLNLLNLCNGETFFLDIGANAGVISCLLSKKIKFGFAFEPVPSSFSRCVKNLNINNFTNIIPLQIAVSNADDLIMLTNLKEALTNYQININTEEGSATAQRDGSVTSLSVKLDSFLIPYIDKISPLNLLIKIDVEGFENFVLEGSHDLLSLNLPMILCLEYNSDEEYLVSISNKLEKYNFKRFTPPKGDDYKNVFFSNR